MSSQSKRIVQLTKPTISPERVEAARRFYSKALERIRAALPEEAAGVVAVEYLMSAYAYKLEHEAILTCIALICEDCRTHKHGGESCVKAAELWNLLPKGQAGKPKKGKK